MLVHEMSSFGMSTDIMMAVEADNKVFIAHAACQSLFNHIWRGKISLDISYAKVRPNCIGKHVFIMIQLL